MENISNQITFMKKGLLSLSTLLLLCVGAFAQDDEKAIKEAALKPKDAAVVVTDSVKHWKFAGSVNANFGQVALVNWAGGGQNSISVLLNGNASAKYAKGKWAWDNDLNISWGIIAQGKLRDLKNNKFPVRKNVDILQLTSKAGYSIDKKNKWFVAGLLDFRSQLTPGYEYPGDSVKTKISQFAAPAYLTLSLGINYKPVSYFSIYLSPVAGKFTFCTNNVDVTRYGVEKGKIYRAEFGAFLRADFQKDIFKNVNLKTSIELFQNYLDKKHKDALVATEIDDYEAINGVGSAPSSMTDKLYYDNRGNTDVNWSTLISFKINKFLQASLETQLIYDHDVATPKFRGDGTAYKGRGTQFREAFNLGIGYKF